jgi:translation elongation factor P/translation initiation factor 5A
MIHWINFLHIYQPPTQDKETLKKVVDESYSHILNLFESFPNMKATFNISGSLLEKLYENEYFEVIEKFKGLHEEGRLELTGSAMYHPILPLITEEEIKHQIDLNTKKFREIFGDSFKPKGFFIPEMAYSEKVGKIIKDFGFEWIILDQIHSPEAKDSSIKYEIENIGLKAIFRNRKFSKSFPPRSIVENFSQIKEGFLITAHDGEMYGHWHKDDEGFYEKIFKLEGIGNITASEYLEKLSETRTVKVIEANWESTEEELSENVPFALWNHPQNEIQKDLWALEKETRELIKRNENDSNYEWAKKHYDKGISSCYWWWASGRKIDVFSPVSWNPTEIEEGLEELLKSVRSLEDLDVEARLKIEEKFSDLRDKIWQRHWNFIQERKPKKSE